MPFILRLACVDFGSSNSRSISSVVNMIELADTQHILLVTMATRAIRRNMDEKTPQRTAS